jgi:hypothetical protein
VVGTDKPVEAPPGISASPRLFRRDVAVLRTTLSGLTGLSESSVRRRDDIGSSQPPRRFDDREAFRRSAPPVGPKTARQLPRLRLPLRVRAKMPSPVLHGPGRPSWGSRPFSDIGGEIRMTRVCLTRHVPSSGFLAPSTGSSPSGLADTLGPLPLRGSSREALSDRKAVVRRRTRCTLSSTVLQASNSEEYEV